MHSDVERRNFGPGCKPWRFYSVVFLLVRAGHTGFLTADSFFRLDPLVGLANMIAARQIVPAMLIGALVALAAAVVLGRAWCGWICPLGTVLDWAPARKAKLHEGTPSRGCARSSTSCCC